MCDGARGKNTYVLDHTTHAGLSDAAATEYLYRIAGGVLCRACRGHLQQTDRTSEQSRLLLVGLRTVMRQNRKIPSGEGATNHVVHLIRDVFQPRLLTLHSGDHLGEFRADDRLRAEGLAECFALVNPPVEE